LIKDERGDITVDPHKILNRWKNYFCHLLNAYGAGGVRQIEMLTAEQLVPDIEVDIGKLKRHKSPGVDQIPKEVIQAGES
jgi:hypothetical protein